MPLMKYSPKFPQITMNVRTRETNSDTVEIEVYQEIVSDAWLAEEFQLTHYKKVSDQINDAVEDGVSVIKGLINSSGGEVYAALSIFNFFYRFAAKNPENMLATRVEMDVIGEAASAASLLPIAADKSRIIRGGSIMIHNPMIAAFYGDYEELSKKASDLKDMTENIADIYAEHTGQSTTQIRKWMNEETTFFDRKAVEMGFIDEVIGEGKPEPSNSGTLDMSRQTEPATISVQELEERGITVEEAEELIKSMKLDLQIQK